MAWYPDMVINKWAVVIEEVDRRTTTGWVEMLGKKETMATTSFRFIWKWWVEGLKEIVLNNN
jgi:hypothetical protein